MVFVIVQLKATRIITTKATNDYLTNFLVYVELYKFGIQFTTTRARKGGLFCYFLVHYYLFLLVILVKCYV